jgi:ribosomal 50S subunit-associated protein YjgA (DUF615 family)
MKEYIENESIIRIALPKILEYNRQVKVEIEKETAKLHQFDGKYSYLIANYEKTLGEVRTKWPNMERGYIEKLFKANIHEYVCDDLDM